MQKKKKKKKKKKKNENEYAEYLEKVRNVDLKDVFSLIIIGDFNAAIGSETSALMPKIVESHTIGDETSRNGMMLSEWCLERKLRIENVFFSENQPSELVRGGIYDL